MIAHHLRPSHSVVLWNATPVHDILAVRGQVAGGGRVGRRIGACNKVHGSHENTCCVTPLPPRYGRGGPTLAGRGGDEQTTITDDPRSFPPPPRTRPPCSRLAHLDLDPPSDRPRLGLGTVRIYPPKMRSRYRSSTCVQSPETLLFATPLPSGECRVGCA